MADEAKIFSQTQLAYMSAVEQIKLFKAGTITPADVLEAQIARVENYNGPINTAREDLKDKMDFNTQVNALCFERFADARKAAKEAAQRYKNGTARPLEGITVGIKNENEVAGWRVDCASLLLKDVPACTEDGAIIERLKNAGAIPVFSTTVPEFYVISLTWSRLYGVTRNPWNLYYGAGGSSGGSGAALAAGFCTLATGSDMGGSIRIPASMCGLYGFKAPFGRVPTSEISYETLGPLARNFDDLVLMQNIICGPSPKVHSSLRPKLEYPAEYKPITGQKVAACYFRQWNPIACDKEISGAMDNALAALKAAGADVDIIDIDWNSEESMTIFWKGLMATEMYGMIAATENADKSKLCGYCRKLFEQIGVTGPKNLMDASSMLKEAHQEIQARVFEKGYTALVMPTFANAPYLPADFEFTPDIFISINGTKVTAMDTMLTPIWNLLSRYPVVNVPVYLTEKCVPIGVQVVGNTFDDLEAFRIAKAISDNTKQLYKDGLFPDFRKEC